MRRPRPYSPSESTRASPSHDPSAMAALLSQHRRAIVGRIAASIPVCLLLIALRFLTIVPATTAHCLMKLTEWVYLHGPSKADGA